ncbi:MAG: hypothetical protein HQL50_08680 [Magnetococcales bacterium]|nr:hypothetical protein [Magnetococcales bacterium]
MKRAIIDFLLETDDRPTELTSPTTWSLYVRHQLVLLLICVVGVLVALPFE